MHELRPPTPDDLEAVAGVLVADDLADSGQVLLDEGFVRDEWRRPGLAVPARDQRPRRRSGWVGEVGVRASHRGRGIAGALLRRSFATFAERGLARVLLNVDSENPTGATALYERVGMRIVWRWDLWERAG